MESSVTFLISVEYKTEPGEEIYIYGNCPDFGNWKEPKFKLEWNEGNIWKGKLSMPISDKNIEFKFVCKINTYLRWEIGDNRILNSKIVNLLPKTKEGEYILECIWNYFRVNFIIYYNLNNINSDMLLIIASNDKDLQEKIKKKEKCILQNKTNNEKNENINIKVNKKDNCWIFKADFKNFKYSAKNYTYKYGIFDSNNKNII